MIKHGNLKIGYCYWVVSPNFYDHMTYEVDKFELVGITEVYSPDNPDSMWMASFIKPKNWRNNKELANYRRGVIFQFHANQVLECQFDAYRKATKLNWQSSNHASRRAAFYELKTHRIGKTDA